MFQGGNGFELLLLGAIALIVVGPKDLPILMRKVGQFVGKLTSMANEFRASFDEMARQSELDELRKEVEAMRQGQLADQAAHGEVSQIFNEIGDSLQGVQFHPPMSHQYDTSALEPAPPMMPEPEIAPKPKPRPARAKASAAVKPKASKGAAPKPAKPATPKAPRAKTTTAAAKRSAT